jgi:hypothetical protein
LTKNGQYLPGYNRGTSRNLLRYVVPRLTSIALGVSLAQL